MQGINLASRPFVNRRPVLRLAVLLWIVGAGLLIHNFRQYTGHWQGSAKHREDFTRLAGQVADEREEFNNVQQDLRKVSVRRENQHTGFLNQLIAFRTFPWSALFDDLEDVVPLNVKLLSVKPNVHLKAVQKKERRTPQRRRARPASAARSEADDTDLEESTRRRPSDESLRRDEVALQLAGIAKDEDAVIEFIEMLYKDPSFRSPYLPGEILERNGPVKFTLTAVYLTGREPVDAEANGTPTEAETVASETSNPEVEEAEMGMEAAPEGSLQASDSRTVPSTRATTTAPAPESSTSSGLAASRTTATRTPEARRSVTRRSEARGSGARNEDERVERRERSAVPRSRIRPRPLTGSRPESDGATGTGTGSTGTTRPGTGRGDGATGTTGTGTPGFSDPPASAPPRVRRSALGDNSEPREAKA